MPIETSMSDAENAETVAELDERHEAMKSDLYEAMARVQQLEVDNAALRRALSRMASRTNAVAQLLEAVDAEAALTLRTIGCATGNSQ